MKSSLTIAWLRTIVCFGKERLYFSFYITRIEGLRLYFRLVSRMSIYLLSLREGLALLLRLVSFALSQHAPPTVRAAEPLTDEYWWVYKKQKSARYCVTVCKNMLIRKILWLKGELIFIISDIHQRSLWRQRDEVSWKCSTHWLLQTYVRICCDLKKASSKSREITWWVLKRSRYSDLLRARRFRSNTNGADIFLTRPQRPLRPEQPP